MTAPSGVVRYLWPAGEASSSETSLANEAVRRSWSLEGPAADADAGAANWLDTLRWAPGNSTGTHSGFTVRGPWSWGASSARPARVAARVARVVGDALLGDGIDRGGLLGDAEDDGFLKSVAALKDTVFLGDGVEAGLGCEREGFLGDGRKAGLCGEAALLFGVTVGKADRLRRGDGALTGEDAVAAALALAPALCTFDAGFFNLICGESSRVPKVRPGSTPLVSLSCTV